MPLRIALLGCGRIARWFHLPLLAAAPGVELRTVADPDPAALAFARRASPAIMAVPDWREALDGIDAVVVALPPLLHAEAACAAFELGCHVYLEKPIGVAEEEGERVVRAWRASGRVGMMGFNVRFDATVNRLRRAMAQGRVGRAVGMRVAIGGPGGEPPAWIRSRSSGGGVLLDLGSHVVDLARYLFRVEIDSAVAAVASRRWEEDTASIVLRLENGVLAQALVTLAGVQESVVEIQGGRGALVADLYAGTLEVRPAEPPQGRRGHLRHAFLEARSLARHAAGVLWPPDPGASYREALAAFVRAASGGPFTGADLEDGHRSLVAIAAAERSAHGGREAAWGTEGA